jgi:isocitrate dehydrogenase
LGAGFKFNFAKRLCFLTNIDFLSAKPEFKDVLITNSNGDFISNTFSQKFGTINIGFGLGLRLNKTS